jgi:hypothetical protein
VGATTSRWVRIVAEHYGVPQKQLRRALRIAHALEVEAARILERRARDAGASGHASGEPRSSGDNLFDRIARQAWDRAHVAHIARERAKEEAIIQQFKGG